MTNNRIEVVGREKLRDYQDFPLEKLSGLKQVHQLKVRHSAAIQAKHTEWANLDLAEISFLSSRVSSHDQG